MLLELEGKVAAVTGGSGGIGSAICRVLAEEGARLAVGYHRHREPAESLVAELRAAGRDATAVQVDVRDADAVNRFFFEVGVKLGSVGLLVNAAGAAQFSPLDDYLPEDFDEVVATNLRGVFLCCRSAASRMSASGGGDIVNVTSLAAATGSFEGGPYAAAKAAVNSLTLSLALELAAQNIRVNAVAPGRIATKFRRANSGPYYDFMLQQTPQKRLGEPREIANAVAFLLSRACGFVTGETLYATGGLHAVYLNHVDSESPWLGGAPNT